MDECVRAGKGALQRRAAGVFRRGGGDAGSFGRKNRTLYAALCREDNPACSEENARLAAQALGQEDYERLKWRVLKRFGVLPSEMRARRMTDREYLYCAAQLLLDEQEKLEAMCPACREKAKRRLCPVCGEPVPEENAGFDEGRFEELKNAGVCETASSDADEAGGAV